MSLRRSEMPFVARSHVDDPNYLLGLVGLVLSVVFMPAGLLISLSARRRSRELGVENEPAEWGVAICTVVLGMLAAALVLGVAFTFIPRLVL
jgi:hypothetical protein